jgi:glycosyltransferase involved in cell wall biosynthesis
MIGQANLREARPQLSLLIPCFNEEQALPLTIKAVKQAFTRFDTSWELILVDDGSADQTVEIIRQAAHSDPRIKGLILSRNFGHQAALSAGLAFCRGSAVGIIDCDLQDPIDVLLKMYKLVEDGKCDVAFGIREKRDAALVLRMTYRLFYSFISRFAEHPWPKDAGDFCVMTRRCVDTIVELPERLRMLRGMRSWIGFVQIGVPYHRPKRIAGTSHYNFWKLTRLALSGIISYSVAPLRLASIIGFVGGFISLLFAIAFVMKRVGLPVSSFGSTLNGNPGLTTLAILISGIGSMVLVSVGILGEYIGVLLVEIKARPVALAKELIGLHPLDRQRAGPNDHERI